MMNKDKASSKTINRVLKSTIIAIAIVVLISICEMLMIEVSAIRLKEIPRCINLCYLVIPVCFFAFFNMLILIGTHGKIRIALQTVFLMLCLIASLVFYFVYLWHGVPFSVIELKNVKTASSVLSLYIPQLFSWQRIYFEDIYLVIISVVLIFFLNKCTKSCSNPILVGTSIISFLFPIVCYLNGSVPQNAVGWSWVQGIYNYGYFNCMVMESINEMEPINKPNDYDIDATKRLLIGKESERDTNSNKKGNTPDIIIVLNESFYDLHKLINIEYSEEPITYLPSLDNALMGYAVVPNEGGGTNPSEYELLTSNSLALMKQSVTPFQSLDLVGANSIVSVLENRGYTTLGTHDCYGINYSRTRGYTNLGFDIVHFEEDYSSLKSWGSRVSDASYTDESQYEDLLKWYEDMGEGPRLLYCLTLQNHGDWVYNSPDENFIKVKNNYGEYNNQLEEYSSCIWLSDKAFKKLVEYYNHVDRDVVIVMVGDHCPYIASSIVDKYVEMDDAYRNLATRSVPYIIWSNNSDLLHDERTTNTMSLVYLMPTVLESADIDMSGYYQYLLGLRNKLPIITKYGDYYDVEGNRYVFGEKSKYSKLVDEYFDIEYMNLTDSESSSFWK